MPLNGNLSSVVFLCFDCHVQLTFLRLYISGSSGAIYDFLNSNHFACAFLKKFIQQKCDVITEQKTKLCYNKATIKKTDDGTVSDIRINDQIFKSEVMHSKACSHQRRKKS